VAVVGLTVSQLGVARSVALAAAGWDRTTSWMPTSFAPGTAAHQDPAAAAPWPVDAVVGQQTDGNVDRQEVEAARCASTSR